MSQEIYLNNGNILIFDDSDLDPNGFPIVVEMTLQEFLDSGGSEDDITSFS